MHSMYICVHTKWKAPRLFLCIVELVFFVVFCNLVYAAFFCPVRRPQLSDIAQISCLTLFPFTLKHMMEY